MEAHLFVPEDWRFNQRYALLWRKGFESELGRTISLILARTSHLFQEVPHLLPLKIVWTIDMQPLLNVDLRTPIGSDPERANDRRVINSLKVELGLTELARLVPNLAISLDVNYRYSVTLNA